MTSSLLLKKNTVNENSDEKYFIQLANKMFPSISLMEKTFSDRLPDSFYRGTSK